MYFLVLHSEVIMFYPCFTCVSVVTSDKLKEIAEANDDLVLMSSALKVIVICLWIIFIYGEACNRVMGLA